MKLYDHQGAVIVRLDGVSLVDLLNRDVDAVQQQPLAMLVNDVHNISVSPPQASLEFCAAVRGGVKGLGADGYRRVQRSEASQFLFATGTVSREVVAAAWQM